MSKARALFLIRGNHMLLPNNARSAFEDLLHVAAGLDATIDEDYSELTPERLKKYDLIVSCAGGALFRYPEGGRHVREANDEEVSALVGAVDAGRPFVGLHCASLMFMNQYLYRQPVTHGVTNPDRKSLMEMYAIRYLEMIGNAVLSWPPVPKPNSLLSATQLQYIDMIGLNFITDDGLAPTEIRITKSDHPVTRGVSDFVITDECYHMVGDTSNIEVLAQSGGWPLIWNRRWGNGKVHYNALGHDRTGVTNANYQRLVQQAITWALDAREV